MCQKEKTQKSSPVVRGREKLFAKDLIVDRAAFLYPKNHVPAKVCFLVDKHQLAVCYKLVEKLCSQSFLTAGRKTLEEA